ncbi:MAG: hypothetical protein AAF436_01310 [Myxococcota bacterium]
MNSIPKSIPRVVWLASISAAVACAGAGVDDSQNAVIDPPIECSPDRPDCSISMDFPTQGDLTPDNSAGLRFSDERGGLVIDRLSALPDEDGDGVPDAADECLGQPGFRAPCDGDASDDGVYRTLFYDPSGTDAALRIATVPVTADIPAIDLYFLVDANVTMSEEIAELQTEISTIVADIASAFADVRFGLGISREYPDGTLAMVESQAPYHHILDLTSDVALFESAVSTLNGLERLSDTSALSQSLYATATGQGLAGYVPNREGCPADTVGFPCFRPDVLRVVLTLTDAEIANGPRPSSPIYALAPEVGSMDLPPVTMEPGLLLADDAATALDLGDLSGRSLTLMGMSTLLNDSVSTMGVPGCMPGDPPMAANDDRDAVVTFRLDTPPLTDVRLRADNTHYGANLALFDGPPSSDDPPMPPAIACNGGDGMTPAVAPLFWGRLAWIPMAGQQYYLVHDAQIAGSGVGNPDPRGAFSISILNDDDPADVTWTTADVPVTWADTETALTDANIRVASVVSPRDMVPNDADLDVRAMATATGAITSTGDQWVGNVATSDGEGLDAQVINTVLRIIQESNYDIEIAALDDPASGFDETAFVDALGASSCPEDPGTFGFTCDEAVDGQCPACEPGAPIDYELRLLNGVVPPIATSQVFDFELVVTADDVVEVDRIPVRVMVPDAAAHEFVAVPEANFYRNTYDSLDRCNVPPERPSWGSLTWTGDTPAGSTIEFQIRTADTEAELEMATPASIIIPTDTTDTTIDIRSELIAEGLSDGLLLIEITAMLNPSGDLLSTPELEGWAFEFTCFAAE